jgi:hypothetical protein
MEILQYTLLASLCLSGFYLAYKLLFRRDTNFRTQRQYLIAAMMVSAILPATNFELRLDVLSFTRQEKSMLISENQNVTFSDNGPANIADAPLSFNHMPTTVIQEKHWKNLFVSLYLIMAAIFLFRIVSRVSRIFTLFFCTEKIRYQGYVLLIDKKFNHCFSFFNWVFIPETIKNNEDFSSVIAHEKIHVSQYHSLDLLLIELLSAVMWFNPLVWMMKKDIQLVHEFLADKGALSTGIDKLGYQALLVNLAAEESIVSLSSGFNPAFKQGNNSLIKKRMIMMTKSKFNQGTKLKILALFPLSMVLFLGVSCVNGQKTNNENVVAAVAATKMNVLYIGVDNPITIAVSGYKASEVDVSVKDNGTITGADGEYIINPARPGNLFVEVKHNGKIIQETRFRVKTFPDPSTGIQVGNNVLMNGNISKVDLLNSGGIIAHLNNFDFDIQFKVESFVISATLPNSTTVREEISKSGKFSPAQIDLINMLIKNQKLMIEHIVISGPDGVKRKVAPMVFTITG